MTTRHLNPTEAWSTEVTRTGVEVRVLAGTVWVTRESDFEDHVLVAPAVFTTDRRGRLATVALTPAVVEVEHLAQGLRPAA
jgi:hypothetical protein